MTKKYLCGVVSAAVLMGACPTAVFAADLENPLDFRSMTEDAADTDAGWAWDASSQTLTVENLSLTVPQGKLEERAAIYLPDESTVRVKMCIRDRYSTLLMTGVGTTLWTGSRLRLR